MKRILRKDAYNYFLDSSLDPLLEVVPKESFTVETEDANNGKMRSPEELPTFENIPEAFEHPPRVNPVAGPIFVEGVEKGDILVVKVEKIIPDVQGATALLLGAGPLFDSVKWQSCNGPYTHIIKHLPGPSGSTRDGIGVFKEGVTWNLDPFIGTIGTAPPYGEHLSSGWGQGPWGGNIDCRHIREGANIYINCYHEGGLLFLGDVHASQADTEISGIADETRAEVQVSCEVIKDRSIPSLRIENERSIITVVCSRPVEDAVKKAIIFMMEWLVDEYGMDEREAYMQMSVNPDVRVNLYQMVDPLDYTVGSEYPKKHL